MNRLLTLARGGLGSTPDGPLLDRFLADRDEAAFAELVRRYAPVVWGTCRRLLPHQPDAEDAFQAVFLVLVRRADRAARHPALGPWLYRVAVLTARNLARANRRRTPLAGRLPHDIPAPDPASDHADARLDLDAALSGLSERHRRAVVLCHLQGLTRKEAADRLGCAEGTLSATLAAALKKLRARLAGRDPLAILVAAGATVPAGLSAAAARTATVYATSALHAAGVSPAVAGLTEGVLRMFWVKKVTFAAGLAVAAAGIAVGFGRPTGAAQQDGVKAPPAKDAAKDADPDRDIARMTEELRKLEDDEGVLRKKLEDLRKARTAAEVRRHQAQQEQVARALAGKAAYWQIDLGGDNWGATPPGVVGGQGVRIDEFDAGGKGLGGYTVSPDVRLMRRVLAGGLADPAGPQKAVVRPQILHTPADQINNVLQACKEAGLKEVIYVPAGTAYPPLFDEKKLMADLGGKADPTTPVVFDLTKFGDATRAVPVPVAGPKDGPKPIPPFFSGAFDDPNFDEPKKP